MIVAMTDAQATLLASVIGGCASVLAVVYQGRRSGKREKKLTMGQRMTKLEGWRQSVEPDLDYARRMRTRAEDRQLRSEDRRRDEQSPD